MISSCIFNAQGRAFDQDKALGGLLIIDDKPTKTTEVPVVFINTMIHSRHKYPGRCRSNFNDCNRFFHKIFAKGLPTQIRKF